MYQRRLEQMVPDTPATSISTPSSICPRPVAAPLHGGGTHDITPAHSLEGLTGDSERRTTLSLGLFYRLSRYEMRLVCRHHPCTHHTSYFCIASMGLYKELNSLTQSQPAIGTQAPVSCMQNSIIPPVQY